MSPRDFLRPRAEETSQAPRRCLVLGIDRHLLGRHAGERAQHCGRTSHRVLIEIETQLPGAAFLGSAVRRHREYRAANRDFRQLHFFHRRTSTARACASRPSARAIAETTGASLFKPAREISWVLEHLTK